MSKTVFVDGMNLLMRVAHVPKFSVLETKSGQSTGCIHGFISSLLLFVKPDDKVYVAWDTRSVRKRQIYPGYKKRRDEPKSIIEQKIYESAIEQLGIIKKILKLMGFSQIRCEGFEADEIIGTLSFNSPRCTILSEDKDFLQLVCKEVNVWQPIKKRLVTHRNFHELYHDISPDEYFIYRTLTGDESDDIDGPEGCGEKTGLTIVRFLRKDPNLENCDDRLVKSLIKKHGIEKIDEITKRNEVLMALTPESVPAREIQKGFTKGNADEDRLESLLTILELEEIKNMWSRR